MFIKYEIFSIIKQRGSTCVHHVTHRTAAHVYIIYSYHM